MKLNKYFIYLICCMIFFFSLLITPNTTYASRINPTEIGTERSDIIQWRYKEINGKWYKRLFNYSTNSWVGDWILVG